MSYVGGGEKRKCERVSIVTNEGTYIDVRKGNYKSKF